MNPAAWPGVRLHVVSGKGGVGKTTVAAALALSLASGGNKVLLMEVENRQGIAQIFDTAPLPYRELKVAAAPDGGEVWALAVDPQEALLDYLEQFYNLRRAGAALKKMGAVDFATTVAPGLRDVLLTGKACELVRRIDRSDPNAYDAIVMDAPPTGRISKFLSVNSEMSGLAKVGPIKNHADLVMSVIASPRTAVHLVTLLEEMPVQETIDGLQELADHDLPIGSVIINMTRQSMLTAEQVDAAASGSIDARPLASVLSAAGLAADLAAPLLAETGQYAQRVQIERAERMRIAQIGRNTAELPLIAAGIDLGALYELSALLKAQGL